MTDPEDIARQQTANLLDQWRDELTKAIKAQTEANARVAKLRKVIDGVESLYPELGRAMRVEFPDVTGADFGGVPLNEDLSAADMVREILRAEPGRWFATGDMVREFRSRGSNASSEAIRLALRRTRGKESERRVSDKGATYRLWVGPTADDTMMGGS